MTTSLTQFNISFIPVEDRLLLRMAVDSGGSTVEFRLWLTRRLVKMLLPILDKMLEADGQLQTRVPEESRKTVMEFQQQAALSKADFTTPYSPEEKGTPLGTAPLLISRIQAGKDKNGRQVLVLKTPENEGININLNPHMIHSMKQLLIQGMQKAQWGLAPDTPVDIPPPVPPGRLI
jgi:hypothetical protein